MPLVKSKEGSFDWVREIPMENLDLVFMCYYFIWSKYKFLENFCCCLFVSSKSVLQNFTKV